MSSTKDPKCLDCGKSLPKDYPFTYCEADWEKRYPTPQATKPVDEQITHILMMVARWETVAYIKRDPDYPMYSRKEATQAIKALLTEARIDELKWVKSRSAKHAGIWIDERNNELDDRIKQLEAQLKNERSNK